MNNRLLKVIYLTLVLYCILFSQTLNAQEYRKYSKKVRKTERQLLKSTHQKQFDGQLKNNATPDRYWIQEYIQTMDPKEGRPTPEVLLPVLQQINNQSQYEVAAMPGTSQTAWIARGPNNVGGRTRALAWDPTDPAGKKVWAGGVTGGLWYNNDITNSNSSWVHVSSLWSNLSISCIAFDPIAPGTIYVGTGEGYGTTSSSSRGFGIWKSIDSGKTFSQLNSTTSYYYVNDIVVRNESGNSVVYAAVDAISFQGTYHGLSSYGLFRSTNGGSSWTNVIGNAPNSQKYAIADLEISADNTLWAGSRNNPYAGTDKGGGRVFSSSNGTTWTVKYTLPSKPGRVELACAPGNSKIVYAVFEFNQKADTMLVTNNAGSTWSSIAKPEDADNGISKWDFTRNQGWYDLILAVDPNDTNTVLVGGIDLFRSTNGGNSWSQISKWSNNNDLAFLNCSYVHADQHAIVFKPGSSSVCLFGNDGGVFYTANLTSAANSNVISERNKDYVTMQFYWGDLFAASGSNTMIGGAQDNGTVKLTSAGLGSGSPLTGGDGGYCFISPTSVSKQISSYVYNNYYYTTDNWSSGDVFIQDATTGKFINPAEWDDNGPGLFTGKGQGALYRRTLTSAPGTLQTITWTASGNVSAIHAAKLSNGKSRLWVGTDAGKLYKTEDAWASSPVFSNATGTINAGNISGIYNLRSGDTIAVTLSNYGVSNIYISTNNGISWTAKDGDLPNQPVWSIVLNPDKIGEAVIATETGVYGTSNIFASSPVWLPYTNGMGTAKIATLRYRKSDKMLMAVTHGRGIFTSDAWSKNTPQAYFGANKKAVCANQSVTFLDSSLNDPDEWKWSATPADYVFTGGTDGSSKNPQIKFTKGGVYSVKLTVKNQIGSDSLTRNSFILVTDTIANQVVLSASRTEVCNFDTFTIMAAYPAQLVGSNLQFKWNIAGVDSINTNSSYTVIAKNNQNYSVQLTTDKYCASPSVVNNNVVSVNIVPKTPLVSRNFDTLFVLSNDPGTYNWYRNGTFVGTGKSLKANQNGKYRAVLVNNGCVSDSSAIIDFNSLSVKTMRMEAGIRPIPADEGFHYISEFPIQKIRIFSTSGTEISSDLFTTSVTNNEATIGIKKLPDGYYFLRVTANSTETTYKFIKQSSK